MCVEPLDIEDTALWKVFRKTTAQSNSHLRLSLAYVRVYVGDDVGRLSTQLENSRRWCTIVTIGSIIVYTVV